MNNPPKHTTILYDNKILQIKRLSLVNRSGKFRNELLPFVTTEKDLKYNPPHDEVYKYRRKLEPNIRDLDYPGGVRVQKSFVLASHNYSNERKTNRKQTDPNRIDKTSMVVFEKKPKEVHSKGKLSVVFEKNEREMLSNLAKKPRLQENFKLGINSNRLRSDSHLNEEEKTWPNKTLGLKSGQYLGAETESPQYYSNAGNSDSNEARQGNFDSNTPINSMKSDISVDSKCAESIYGQENGWNGSSASDQNLNTFNFKLTELSGSEASSFFWIQNKHQVNEPDSKNYASDSCSKAPKATLDFIEEMAVYDGITGNEIFNDMQLSASSNDDDIKTRKKKSRRVESRKKETKSFDEESLKKGVSSSKSRKTDQSPMRKEITTESFRSRKFEKSKRLESGQFNKLSELSEIFRKRSPRKIIKRTKVNQSSIWGLGKHGNDLKISQDFLSTNGDFEDHLVSCESSKLDSGESNKSSGLGRNNSYLKSKLSDSIDEIVELMNQMSTKDVSNSIRGRDPAESNSIWQDESQIINLLNHDQNQDESRVEKQVERVLNLSGDQLNDNIHVKNSYEYNHSLFPFRGFNITRAFTFSYFQLPAQYSKKYTKEQEVLKKIAGEILLK